MVTDRAEISIKIKNLAHHIGFTDCGITPARILPEDGAYLKKWLRLEMHAGMKFMENHFEKRTDPSKLMPGAKSVIVVLLNYFPAKQQSEKGENLLISKYAYGRDYHKVIQTLLKTFLRSINDEIIECQGRVFVDSAPVLERTLAVKAGLGWIGRNSNLISPRFGSFVFIGEIMINVPLEYDSPLPDYCGTCNKCLNSCPTHALVAPQKLDSRKCISYWTIEHRGPMNIIQKVDFKNRIFGCDICQDVCPWNQKAKANKIKEFQPAKELLSMSRSDWHNLTKEKYQQLFVETAVTRAGYEQLLRNIKFVSTT